MKPPRRWTALLAAAVSCGLGVAEIFHPDRNLPRVPPWAPLLESLTDAPIPKGSPVGFLPPAGSDASYERFLFLEAAWRRPDLLWVPSEELRVRPRTAFLVSVASKAAVPGWQEVWRAGDLRLLRRAQP